jgi:hypothetical protein
MPRRGPSGCIAFPIWIVLVVFVLTRGGILVPEPVRRTWNGLFATSALDTHGSARFGTAQTAARHLGRQHPSTPSCWEHCRGHRATPIVGSAKMVTC